MFIQSYITIASSYLLIGVVIALLLELVIRKYTEFEIKPLERFFLIVAWPIMALIFIYNFINGMKKED
jgi:hypothetical protein|tara:strand:+ start:270 stop:473 length:204 start_codon:yes stop_codon:yes gene_type:complete